jgi:hypothetical protein
MRGFVIALLLGSVLGIGGCATQQYEPAGTDHQNKPVDELDKDKVFKKEEDSDDMERLD